MISVLFTDGPKTQNRSQNPLWGGLGVFFLILGIQIRGRGQRGFNFKHAEQTWPNLHLQIFILHLTSQPKNPSHLRPREATHPRLISHPVLPSVSRVPPPISGLCQSISFLSTSSVVQ